MGFFSKKNCNICGEKIGLLGNKKLEDGNMCKDCAKKLSPWFGERRNSTLSEINEQLAYREDNKIKVSNFTVSRELGFIPKVLIDQNKGEFMVSFDDDYIKENPDVINISDVNDCVLDVNEKKTEIMRIDKDGNEVSHMIRRYDYFYDFYTIIKVNNPYFDEIRFKLNTYTVDGNSRQEYDEYNKMGEEICKVLSSKEVTGDNTERKQNEPNTSKSIAFCPNCGAPVTTDESKFCNSCGSALI